MAKISKRLSARATTTITKPGLHADGDGLYLVVDTAGARRWSYIFQWDGKRKEMGLGNLATVGLADARVKAADARKMVLEGQNPIKVRQAVRAARQVGEVDFGTFADDLIDGLATQFRNDKHIDQWRMTLREYAAPLRGKRLDEIDTADLLQVLQPIWSTKTETASRLRGRIERVLDAAKAKGLRNGENPARWRGHLDALLPKRQKLARGHHAAMPYVDVSAFLDRLHESDGIGASALEFCILTASRTGEVIGAHWSEFDLDAAVWTVPAGRMKAGREHRVPLADPALAIVRHLHEKRVGDHVFPGNRKNSAISNATMMKALVTAGGKDFTVHGFRSSFRDWVGEETAFSENLAEAALAHVVGDATERAYRRGDALAKRRMLMEAWAGYCLQTQNDNVVPIRGTAP